MSTVNCSDVLPPSDVWSKYVHGLEEYMHHFIILDVFLLATLGENKAALGIQQKDIMSVVDFFFRDGFWDALSQFQYLFAEGIPHPRNLTGCSFMASAELQLILGADLCAGEQHTSLSSAQEDAPPHAVLSDGSCQS